MEKKYLGLKGLTELIIKVKTALNTKQDTLIFDKVPTESSKNPVESGGIKSYIDQVSLEGKVDLSGYAKTSDVDSKINTAKSELQNSINTSKQDKLTFDDTPTANSDNPVKSGGIKNYVDGQVSKIPKFSIAVVDQLPTSDISTTTIYLLKESKTDTQNIYAEYIYVNNAWEILGTQKVDLSGYVKTADLETKLNKKQDTLEFDQTPTAGSNKPVTSGGIFTALDAKVNASDFVEITESEVDQLWGADVPANVNGKRY